MLLGLAFLIRIHAQPGGKNSNTPSVTTNWVGCLVIGEKDTVDAISPGAHPKSLEHVQLGLRSDGVVVWRNSTTGK
jgi:hypothetical protein